MSTHMDRRRIVMGIDPGNNGGIALMTLNDKNDVESIRATPMPTMPAGKGTEVDARGVANWIKGNLPFDGIIVKAAVESVHSMPKQGVSSSFKFGKGYGMVLGVLSTLYIPIAHVTPQSWKKILDSLGRDKEDAIRFVISMFPDVDLKATEKSKKHHDGMAEAICMAEWARRGLLGDQKQ